MALETKISVHVLANDANEVGRKAVERARELEAAEEEAQAVEEEGCTSGEIWQCRL